MANLKEIRNRIGSVSSTMQITSAMKMVSAAKLKKAQDAITAMRPYSNKLTQMLVNLSSSIDFENIYLKQLKTYGALNRDPQERVISIVYFSLIRVDKLSLKMVENYDAKWFAFNELPELILDHSQMVKDSISELRNIAKDQPLGFELLPKLFTLPQLQTLYECIYNTKFDSRNFRKKILSLNVLEKTNLKDKSTSRKGAFLFGFKENVLNNNQKDAGTYNTKDVFQF